MIFNSVPTFQTVKSEKHEYYCCKGLFTFKTAKRLAKPQLEPSQ